jgi:hypothetical protein
MTDRRRLGAGLLAISLTMALVSGGDAFAKAPRKPDLGDAVQGEYSGDVISDSQGSSRDDVRLTVTRIGKNRVEVTSNYGRLPDVTVSLERAMDKIVQRSGDTVFLYDPGRGHLDVTFEGVVSWSGARR